MTRLFGSLLLCVVAILAAVTASMQPSGNSWRLTSESEALVPDAALRVFMPEALKDVLEGHAARTQMTLPHR